MRIDISSADVTGESDVDDLKLMTICGDYISMLVTVLHVGDRR